MTQDPLWVDAAPTKAFFVNMLVRDIGLIPAIADLVDNSVDGARRARPHGDFDRLWVRISFTADSFIIEDNCGGMPLNIARNYAFRFGRPDEMPATPHSIGQFGVGMKRALFKIGSTFVVDSRTAEDEFVLPVDVSEWLKSTDWEFRFRSAGPRTSSSNENGTKISISKLAVGARGDFGEHAFENQLMRALEGGHREAISAGLLITVNGNPIAGGVASVLQSSELRSGYEEITLNSDSQAPLRIKVYAGIGPSSPEDFGWYIYCNGRLLVGPDQTVLSGWGETSPRIPKAHNQYARFRGYVFFDSDDTSALPWTTTKTGVDAGSAAYKSARIAMIQLMRPVIDFLNELDNEKDSPPDDRPSLESYVNAAVSTPISKAATSPAFVRPKPQARAAKVSVPTVSIQFRKETARVDRLKSVLGASSASDLGSRCFDYVWEQEVD